MSNDPRRRLFMGGPGGAPGPANVLTIRSILTGPAGSAASATVSGTAPNQVIDLIIPRGDVGAAGPAAYAPIVPWAQGLLCVASAPATTVSVNGGSYVCAVSNIASASFATDLAAGYWLPLAPAGAAGNGIQNGSGAPANSLGANGDFYLDTANTRLYGPKASGAWPTGYTSLVGAGALLASNNLSDVASVGQALANLKQAPVVASANTPLAVTDFDRPALLTGSPTLTAPNGGAGWRTGSIKNANTVAGVVTLAVPAGATLDGVTNGTTALFPYQRARLLQIGPSAYVTDWIERTPILVDGTTNGLITAAVASADLVLPAGYSRFRLRGANVALATSGASFGVRFGDAGGVKAGASDYVSQRTQSFGSTVQGRSLPDAFGYIMLTATDGGQATKGILDFQIWPGATGSNPEMLGQSYFYDGSPRNLFQSGIEYTGGTTGAMARATLLRLLASSGNFTGSFTLMGEP